MNKSMTTAVNTINQLQKQFDIISHNIANSQTNGFKRRDVSFAEMVFQEINNQPAQEKEVGRTSPLGIRQGVGAMIAKSVMVLQQGTIQNTDRSLDIAFTENNQFLKVLVQDGNGSNVRFTRNGALYVTPTGNNELMLVTKDGNPILDENENMITFSDQLGDYTISKNGTFQASNKNGQTMTANLGIIALNKPQFMEQKGDNLIGLPDNTNEAAIYADLTGATRNNISIQQGALEGSNVDLSKEMTEMMSVQRALQFQSRSITLSDQMLGLVNGIR
ncbi:flagellar hook-basal body protein [Lederbergia citrea]|uniref:Flagellar hook-basal body protein n=1 Tax=Lederbergia citrea TaxID=2833581 RepID=A0A942Z5X5_9BACI|nr:flagellar hook-basal body protein [Lederbergia citrea]MBS4178075.1 flagellar hook-basal body protein [Lederbergia citrea]MBS4223411.1 flagellar hook-basal body protein [Lederbergia citrea]